MGLTDTWLIQARELEADDVWLGEDGVELDVHRVEHLVSEELFIPWEKGRSHPPVPMKPVVVVGTIHRPGERPFGGRWTLQPDMPLEVRREHNTEVPEVG